MDGVAQVQVYGSQKYAVRIQLDPQQLAARGASGSTRWRPRCRTGTSTCRPASCGAPTRRTRSRARASSPTAPEFAALVVAYRDGAPVRLGDLGNVLDSVQDTKRGELVQRGAADRARDPAPARHQHRGGGGAGAGGGRGVPAADAGPVEMTKMYDRSQTVEASVTDVKFTLFLALCLVVMVIFLFLRNSAPPPSRRWPSRCRWSAPSP